MKPIPQKQLAWITNEPGQLKLREIDVPKPGKGEVLIKIEYSGLCHTDIHIIEGDCSMPQNAYPLISGHEGVGYVIEIGDGVQDIEIENIANCLEAKYAGIHVNGAHQQYALGKQEFPELNSRAPIMCGGLTSFSALKSIDLLPGQWVAISGAGGGLGHLGVQYAKALGYRVIAIDKGEKRQFVLSLGADHFLDYKTDDVITQVRDITTGGVHALIVFSSSASAYNRVFEYLRPRGILIVAGVPPDGILQIDVLSYARVLVGTATCFKEALDYVVRGIVKPCCQLVPFSKLPQAILALKTSSVTGRLVLDMNLD